MSLRKGIWWKFCSRILSTKWMWWHRTAFIPWVRKILTTWNFQYKNWKNQSEIWKKIHRSLKIDNFCLFKLTKHLHNKYFLVAFMKWNWNLKIYVHFYLFNKKLLFFFKFNFISQKSNCNWQTKMTFYKINWFFQLQLTRADLM